MTRVPSAVFLFHSLKGVSIMLTRLSAQVSRVLIIASISILTGSSLMLSESAWANVPLSRACTSSTSAQCSSCAGTGQVFQCRPAPLGGGLIYGLCPKTAQTVSCYNQSSTSSCGTQDWNCQNPPAVIAGSSACGGEYGAVCSKTSG